MTYDVDGRLLTRQSIQPSQPPRYLESYTYDASGFLVIYTIDVEGDGKLDERRTYTADGQGRRLSETVDVDDDGSVDSVITYEWEHSTLEHGTIFFDVDGDGQTDASIYVERDERGQETLRIEDENHDGQPEEILEAIYDESGRPVETEEIFYSEHNGRRSIRNTHQRTWSYDAKGRELSHFHRIYAGDEDGLLITDIRIESNLQGNCP